MRSEQEEDKEEAFWKMDGALYTTAGWRKREKKRNLSRRNPPRTGLSRTAPRAEKRETHISRHVLCVCNSSILRIDRVLLSLSLSHPNKKFALCASKISSSPSSKRTPKRTTRRETRNATASLLKPIINNAYNYSYLHGCLLSFGIF